MPNAEVDQLVAQRAPAPGNLGGCKVCQLPVGLIQLVNAEIWDGRQRRTRYIKHATRVLEEAKSPMARDTIAGHAKHTEETWRIADSRDPGHKDEMPVFPIDFESVTDRIANLGMLATQELESRVRLGLIDSRDLAGVTRMGLTAVVERQKAADRSKRPDNVVVAIFGSVSGHLKEPEGTVRNVTPLNDLLAGLDAERLALSPGEEDVDYDEALAL